MDARWTLGQFSLATFFRGCFFGLKSVKSWGEGIACRPGIHVGNPLSLLPGLLMRDQPVDPTCMQSQIKSGSDPLLNRTPWGLSILGSNYGVARGPRQNCRALGVRCWVHKRVDRAC